MKLCLVDKTAVDFYRNSEKCFANLRRSKLCRAPQRLPQTSEVLRRCTQFSSVPVHVLLSSPSALRNNATIVCRRHSGLFPEGSFYALNRNTFIASPEYLFLRASSSLALVPLIQFGYSLCGGGSFYGGKRQTSLTTARRIKSFLERSEGIHGVKKAKQAVKHVLDGAESPREIALAMKLTLPCRLGGYGLPNPILNYEVELSSADSKALGKRHLRIDVAWPQFLLALEYESNEWHSAKVKLHKDSQRRNVLMRKGYRVITVTDGEMKSVVDMDRIASMIAKELGVRLRTKIPEYVHLKEELRDHFEGW